MSRDAVNLQPHVAQLLKITASKPQLKAAVSACPPPNLQCKGVTSTPQEFENWSLEIDIFGVPTAKVNNADDVVCIANWAKDNGYTIRPVGQSHNWSPLVLPNGTDPCSKVLLVDTQKLKTMVFNSGPNPSATFGTGVTIEECTAFLEQQNNNGASQAPGYSFLNFTAPGKLSLGGVLAIGGHGTGIPVNGEPNLDGCLSNLIVSFKAVVTDPAGDPQKYVIKQFSRSDADASAFLVHLGRAFIVEVTLAVVPNFYLQVQNLYPHVDILFQPATAPSNPQSLAGLLKTYGRLEAIWFAYTTTPWVKTWQYQSQEIQPQVPGPYNYPWANKVPKWLSNLICDGLRALPSSALVFGPGELIAAVTNAPTSLVLNGTARDLLLYVENDTLRVTAFGYALQLALADVQGAMNAFYAKFVSLLAQYNKNGDYPVNVAIEVRITTVDFVQALGVNNAAPPNLSVCNPASGNVDTVLWLDILTVPATPSSYEFFQEMETWMDSQWGSGGANILRPEWSKGWAYTSAGAWTNQQVITQNFPAYFGASFQAAQQILAKYDKFHIYTNALLNQLLPG